ncbi:MAG TPA: HAMP domain-containing sensor histidine kinase [Holophagaceae bacterium]|nr:HAMP domain-containing sensor histidine kinase [Holophagaceae bacterium]
MSRTSWKAARWTGATILLLEAVLMTLSPQARVWPMALLTLVVVVLLAEGAFARRRDDPALGMDWRPLIGFGLLGTFNVTLQLFQLALYGYRIPHPPLTTLLLWTPAMGFLLSGLYPKGLRSTLGAGPLLDGAIFGTAAYLGLWIWVVQPILGARILDPLLALGVHATFLMAFTTLGVALHIGLERGFTLVSPLGLVTGGIAWIAALLPWWVSVLLGGSFQYAHPIRIVMIPGFLLVYLGTQAPWPTRPRRPREALRLALPYLPSTLAFFGFLAHYLPGHVARDTPGFALLGLLGFLVLLRQALTLRQLHRLNVGLEEQVEARTRELTRSQGLLMETQQKNLVATLGAGITHDLNNLLGAALGNLDLLRLKSDPMPETRELRGLEQALERAGNLSRSLMGLAREGPGPARAFDLVEHLRDLHPLLRAMVPRNLELAWELEEVPLPIHGNPGQVDQVVVNLVSNAMDATPSGGRITVRARREGQDAVLEVEDTGSGIPPHVMARLFEPFLTTKPPGKGTGLGLSSVQAVVELLGGRIQVRSREGEGTVFTVRLPPAP